MNYFQNANSSTIPPENQGFFNGAVSVNSLKLSDRGETEQGSASLNNTIDGHCQAKMTNNETFTELLKVKKENVSYEWQKENAAVAMPDMQNYYRPFNARMSFTPENQLQNYVGSNSQLAISLGMANSENHHGFFNGFQQHPGSQSKFFYFSLKSCS